GTTIESSRPLIEVFAGSFDVVVHDQRGLGRPSVPDEPFTMADYAADAAALHDHVRWATSRGFRVRFGGLVALEYAVSWPERVERLVLACTSAGGAGGSSYPLHELQALPPDEQVARGLAILDSRFSPEWFADHPGDRALVEMQAGRRAEPRS